MIRHIKLLSIFICLTLVFTISCKENKTQIDKQSIVIAKQENTIYNWQFLNAFALDNPTNEISNSKFENLKFKIIKDSIFIENIGKEALYKGEINSKKYFNRIYDYEYLKKFLNDKFNIKIKESLTYLRNKNIHKKNSILKNYFDDAFILNNLLFLINEEAIVVYTDSSTLKNTNIVTPSKKCLDIKKIEFPYNKKIDINKVHYNITKCNIKRFSKWTCGENQLRYIPLFNIKNINLILIPMDCGDSPYRFYLLSILKNSVSSLYVEGELYEPENIESKETTSFEIDKNHIIKVKTIDFDGTNIIKTYKITNQGKIEEVK